MRITKVVIVVASVATALATTSAVAQFRAKFGPELLSASVTETHKIERVINVKPNRNWVNVAEFERVKIVVDGSSRVVEFGGIGMTKLEVGSKELTVYVGINPMFFSPGE